MPALARAAAVVTVVLAPAVIVLAILGHDFTVFVIPGILGWALMGWLLLDKRPGHPMGPLLCLIALSGVLAILPVAYERYVLVNPAGSLPFGTQMLWVNTWAFAPATSLSGLVLPLVFPEGRLPSRRWRPALWAALGFIPLAAVGSAFAPETMDGYFRDVPNPYPVSAAAPLFFTLLALGLACAVFAAVAAAAAVVQRWRRAGRVQRQQLKWFVAVLPLTAAALVSDALFADSPASSAVVLSLMIGSLGGFLMPVAIGVAVLRYRLYEIDILLNRAVLYGLLSAAATGVYLAVVGIARLAFGLERELPVQILATVLAGVAFWPFRDRVQRGVNRLFYGDRGAPYVALAKLRQRIAEAADADSALDSIVRTVADSMRLPYAAIELRSGNGWVLAAAYGEPPPDVAKFPLTSQREWIGRLLIGTRPGDQIGPDDERLLADLARQAGPAAHAVALRRALDASRAELVTAREEQRRRLRRDLHDGLGPTLAGLTLGLDTAAALVPDDPRLRELLGRLKAETQRTVADVRRIVYGLRPPALDELGLADALREEVGRLRQAAPGLAVTLDVSGDELAELPAAAEVACYWIVSEALANVTRHAYATQCLVSVRAGYGGHGIAAEVSDDGVGLPEGWRACAGIRTMRERVAELGGTLEIGANEPRGTTVAARLPAREGR